MNNCRPFLKKFLPIFLLFVSINISKTSRAQLPNEFVFSLGQATLFKGLGAQVWPGDSPERDSLIKDLRMTWVRAAICPSPPSGLVSALNTPRVDATLLDSPESSSWQIKQSVSALSQELSTLNLQLHLMIGSPPPQWMETFEWLGAQVNKLKENYVSNYAQLVVGCLLYLRERDILPVSVELINEPDAYTSAVDPDVYVSLVTETRHFLNQYGFENVQIEGPGTSITTKALPYLQAVHVAGAWGALGYISAHNWDTVLGTSPAGMPELVQQVLAFPTKAIWATEFGDESPRWSLPEFGAPPWERTGGPNAADTTEYGAAVAAEALKMAGEGVTGFSYWELADQSWETTSWGLLDLTLNRRPAAFALQTIFGNIPPASYEVGGVCTACGSVVATTFIKFDRLYTAIANEGDTAAHVLLSFQGLPISSYPTRILSLFPNRIAQNISVSLNQSGALSVSIPGSSVVVLTNNVQ